MGGGTHALHNTSSILGSCVHGPSPHGSSAKCTQLTSLVTDEISICRSWWTIEPNKACRKQPHRNTILDIHQSEQHVSPHLTEHIPLWWRFLFKGIVCYSSCCSLVYWLLAWCLIPTYVICLCLLFMIYSVKLLPLKKLNSKSQPKIMSITISVFLLWWKLRNSWFFEEMLSHFHCPHESLATFFSVWIKNWAIF